MNALHMAFIKNWSPKTEKIKIRLNLTLFLQKMAEFLRERGTCGTDLVSTPMGAHNMTFIEV